MSFKSTILPFLLTDKERDITRITKKSLIVIITTPFDAPVESLNSKHIRKYKFNLDDYAHSLMFNLPLIAKILCHALYTKLFTKSLQFFLAISSTPTSTVGIQQVSHYAPGGCKESETIESPSVTVARPGSDIGSNYSNVNHEENVQHLPQCHIQRQQQLQSQSSLPNHQSSQTQPQQQSRQQRTRLRSLDTFRGLVFTIFYYEY